MKLRTDTQTTDLFAEDKPECIDVFVNQLMSQKTWLGDKHIRTSVCRTLCAHDVDKHTGRVTNWIDTGHTFLKPGAANWNQTCTNVRNALKVHQDLHGVENVRVVRGYKLFQATQSGVLTHGWRALAHLVLEVPCATAPTGRTLKCVTALPEDQGNVEDPRFLFIRSSRVHADLTDEQLLSGAWLLGMVFGGDEIFALHAVEYYKSAGRAGQSVGSSPETCTSVRGVVAIFPSVFCEWASERHPDEDVSALAEVMGCPVRDRGVHSAATTEDGACGACVSNGLDDDEDKVLVYAPGAPDNLNNREGTGDKVVQRWNGKKILKCTVIRDEDLDKRNFRKSEHAQGTMTWEEMRSFIRTYENAYKTYTMTRAKAYKLIYEMLDEQRLSVNRSRAERLSLKLGKLGLLDVDVDPSVLH